MPSLPSLMAQCAFFSALGSVLAQVFVMGLSKGFDWGNLMGMVTYGAFIFAPFASVWYPFLEDIAPGGDLKSMFIKVGLDQAIASTLLVSCFYLWTTYLSTRNVDQSVAAVREKLFPTLKTNWLYWIPVQSINLTMVPSDYSVLVMNIASIPWNMFVSYMASKPPAGAAAPPRVITPKGKKRKAEPKDKGN